MLLQDFTTTEFSMHFGMERKKNIFLGCLYKYNMVQLLFYFIYSQTLEAEAKKLYTLLKCQYKDSHNLLTFTSSVNSCIKMNTLVTQVNIKFRIEI